MKFVSFMHIIYFAAFNSQYFNTASYCRLVSDAPKTFSADPTLIVHCYFCAKKITISKSTIYYFK